MNGVLTIDPHDPHPHFQGEPFGVRALPDRGEELPELESATREDIALAAYCLGPLAIYGGFLRAALAGIYAERAAAIEESNRE
jgi:hypothetical protein